MRKKVLQNWAVRINLCVQNAKILTEECSLLIILVCQLISFTLLYVYY
jgi:hypothetical protein